MKKFLWKALTLMAVLVLFAFPAEAAGTVVPLKIEGIQNYSEINEVLKYVNQYRAEAGVDPVVLDEELTALAMQRAAELMVQYSHDRPSGKGCFTIFEDTVFGYYSGGENIAMGATNAANVSLAWYNSPGHYGNMVKSSYVAVGIGCFHQPDGTKGWVQLFSAGTSGKVSKTTGQKTVSATVMTKSDLIELAVAPLDQEGNLLLFKGDTLQTPVIFTGGFSDIVLGDCYQLYSDNASVVKVDGRKLTGVSQGKANVKVVMEGVEYAVTARVYAPLGIKYTVTDGTALITWEDPTGVAKLFYRKNQDDFWRQPYGSETKHSVYLREGDVITAVLRVRCGDEYMDVSPYITVTRDGMKEAKILTQPKTGYAKLGGTVKTTVKAEGDGLTYTWYIKNAGATKYSKSSVTTATYSCGMTDTSRDRRVYCVIQDAYGNKVQSNTVYLRMAASIVTQPKTVSGAMGETVKTTVKAQGDGLTYTWYVKNADQSAFSKSSVTSATYSCKLSEASDGRQLYCVVKDRYGKTEKSNVVTIQEKVKITTQPKTTYTKLGSTAKVTVKAEGDGLTYQWYIRNASGSTYSKSSITSATYSCKMSSSVKDRRVYCVVKDAYGNTVQTKTVILRMAASITSQPINASAAKGKTVSVTVGAAGDGLTYTWYIKNASGTKFSVSSVTGATYSCTMSATSNGRQIYCVVTDKYGNTVKSNVVTLSMK